LRLGIKQSERKKSRSQVAGLGKDGRWEEDQRLLCWGRGQEWRIISRLFESVGPCWCHNAARAPLDASTLVAAAPRRRQQLPCGPSTAAVKPKPETPRVSVGFFLLALCLVLGRLSLQLNVTEGEGQTRQPEQSSLENSSLPSENIPTQPIAPGNHTSSHDSSRAAALLSRAVRSRARAKTRNADPPADPGGEGLAAAE